LNGSIIPRYINIVSKIIKNMFDIAYKK